MAFIRSPSIYLPFIAAIYIDPLGVFLSSIRRVMFKVMRSRAARYSSPSRVRFRIWSSFMTTSSTQWRLFSIFQWPVNKHPIMTPSGGVFLERGGVAAGFFGRAASAARTRTPSHPNSGKNYLFT